MNPVFKFDSNEPEFNTIYAHELNKYLTEGVEWSAEPFKNAFIADMQQFGADSFAAGWLAYRSQAVQLFKNALPFLHLYSNQAKTGYDTLHVNQNIKNITEFLEVNVPNPWKTPYGCPKPEALKTAEEKKAEQLRALHKTPYGAALGKNGPEIVPGLTFANQHMPGHTFEVKTINAEENTLNVYITKDGGMPWPDTWNLQHTRWGFEHGEYWQVENKNEADALKKRQFPAGGVVMPHHIQWCNPGAVMNLPECGGSFEARKQHNKPVTDELASRINEKRKEAGRQIMEDIERKTLDALNSLPKEYAYIPADLYEEYNKNAVALAQLSAQNKRHTLEYKQLADKACELADKMKKVKKEAIEKEAADKMAKMVAGVMQVTDSFMKAAKAIQVFNREAKEAEATRKKFEHMAPKTGGQNPHTGKKYITDEKGFLFVAGNGEILWALHDGAKYCFCEWDGNAWIGWKVEESAVIEAGHTQLPIFLDHFIRSIHPTE